MGTKNRESECVEGEGGAVAQLDGRAGTLLKDKEEVIPATSMEYVIVARSLHAKSTAVQAKKALLEALHYLQGFGQVCTGPEEWFSEYGDNPYRPGIDLSAHTSSAASAQMSRFLLNFDQSDPHPTNRLLHSINYRNHRRMRANFGLCYPFMDETAHPYDGRRIRTIYEEWHPTWARGSPKLVLEPERSYQMPL